MADATIGSLPALSELDDNSLLVAEQGGSAQKLSGAQIKAFAVAAAEAEAAKAAQSATDAAAAKTAAENAKSAAQSSATVAVSSQSKAEEAANEAASSASSSGYSSSVSKRFAESAQNYANDAATSANSASAYSRSSASSADSASRASTAANSAATAAETAKTAAETAKEAAESAKADAESAKTAAESSATSSAASATAAGNSANDAASARDAILNMIVSAITLNTGEPATVQKSVVDEVFKLTFGLPRGEKGEVGSPGRGITSITLKSGTHAAGTVDTYTVTFTDNTTYDFQVTNGANGADGFSPTITVSKTGKVTTVTITDVNGTQSVEINDGADGQGSGDMLSSVYDPTGKAQDIFAYVDDAIKGVTIETDATPTQNSTNPVQSGGVYTELEKKLAKTGNGSNVTANFTAASSRTNIATGEKLSVLFGKIAKWLADLGSLAFKSKVAKADLAEDVQMSLGKADSALQSAPVTSVNGQTGKVTVSAPAASTTAPKAPGTASVGVEDAFARGDHVHPSEVFVATYGTTTLEEIEDAYNAGKIVLCQDAALLVPLSSITSAAAIFSSCSQGTVTTLFRWDDSIGWKKKTKELVPETRKVNGKALSANITLGEMHSATLAASGWTTSGDWKTQTVEVSGLKATYNAAPFVDVSLTGTDAAGDAELAAAWLGISETLIADTAANSITIKFPATVDTPTVNIPLTITTYD